MSCCNNRRTALSRTAQLRSAAAVAAAAPANIEPAIRLRYLLESPLGLRGPYSGRIYRMDGQAPHIDAHPLDAPALLRSGLFERGEAA